MLGFYIPNALATLGTPLEICNRNSAAAQDGGSAAEQETNQELKGGCWRSICFTRIQCFNWK
jgi:hypothetical protein